MQSLQSTIDDQDDKFKVLEQSVVAAANAQRTTFTNQDRTIDAVGERQRKRKLSRVKTTAQKVLWFLETFGLDAELLQLRSLETGDKISVILTETSTCASSSGSNSDSSQDHTSSQDHSVRQRIRQSLYLLERFGVSDGFYHELTQLCPELPRSYQVKKLRTLLSSQVEVESLPPPCQGTICPFTSYLTAVLCIEVKKIY